MLNLILTVGVPACGKSTWAKQQVAKDPTNWVRINNDDLRAMANGTVFTTDYEKFIASTRIFMIKEALMKKKNVILDNVNMGKRNFEEACKAAQAANVDVKVFEKPFYVDLDEAIERDSKREGSSKVGVDVIKKFWKASGGKQHKYYVPREEIYLKKTQTDPPEWDDKLPNCIMVDLDGTLALFEHHRSPYDASNCDKDLPNKPVVDIVKMFYANDHKIIFCSGREDKDRDPTIKFIECHLPGIEYSLFMRPTGDVRKDFIVKGEIYDEKVRGKYNVAVVFDDRSSVVELAWRARGLTCFQVAPGEF